MAKEKESNKKKEEKEEKTLEESADVIELSESPIVIWLPTNTVEVEIAAKVWHNKEVITVGKILEMQDVKIAFKDAEENYIPGDAEFVITKNGSELEEKLKEKN